jgi:hypothetical protein
MFRKNRPKVKKLPKRRKLALSGHPSVDFFFGFAKE